jgi:hypothetical protein
MKSGGSAMKRYSFEGVKHFIRDGSLTVSAINRNLDYLIRRGTPGFQWEREALAEAFFGFSIGFSKALRWAQLPRHINNQQSTIINPKSSVTR